MSERDKIFSILPKPNDFITPPVSITRKKKRSYVCHKCKKSHASYDAYINHKTKVVCSSDISVHDDGTGSSNATEEGAARNLVICEFCYGLLSDTTELKNHIKSCHENGKYECIQCNKYFIGIGFLMRHVKTRHKSEDPAFSCLICKTTAETLPLAFNTKYDLIKHCKDQHADPLNELAMNGSDNNMELNMSIDFDDNALEMVTEFLRDYDFDTNLDNIELDLYSDEQNLSAIEEKVRQEQRYAIISKFDDNEDDDDDDDALNTMNTLSNKSDTTKFKFMCKICEARFKGALAYINHINAVHAANLEQPYQCFHCSRDLKSKSNLKAHMERKHPVVATQICFLCKRKFTTADHLKKHVLSVHSNERLYRCPQCKYLALQKSHLTKHMLTHKRQELKKRKDADKERDKYKAFKDTKN